MYREGQHVEALELYTQALALARTNSQKIAFHSNRAACFLKLHDFKKAAKECTSVLELDPNHTGALMLRAQTLVTLKEYHSALFDVNRLTELNPDSEVYRNLHARLKTQLSLAPIPEAETETEQEEDEEEGEKEKEKEEEEKVLVDKTSDKKDFGKSVSNATSEQNSEQNSERWKTIPKPKGHSQLDYSRWDRVKDDSSDDDDSDDNEDSQPQFRFRVKTVGVRPVK